MLSIRIKKLSYKYPEGTRYALSGVNFVAGPGDFVVLLGSNGSGKTTLLKCINGLIVPSTGEVSVDGCNVVSCSHPHLLRIRQRIGMIPQDLGLLQRSSALENVVLGRLAHMGFIRASFGWFSRLDYDLAAHSLALVGLNDGAKRLVSDLSGGERQRVAVARALCQEPEAILADEPLSNIDPNSRRSIMCVLSKLCREEGIVVVMALHLLGIAREFATKIIGLRSGRILLECEPTKLTEKVISDIYGC
jgi:phosphonate transport system ATP-binding protein